MEFGERLATLRKAKGLSQDALGKGLGTPDEDGKRTDAGKQVVLGWEKGRHFPKVDQFALICNRLGCSSDYLLFGAEGGLSGQATELGRELDAIGNPQEREQAFQICRGTIRMASSHPMHGVQEITQQVTRRAN